MSSLTESKEGTISSLAFHGDVDIAIGDYLIGNKPTIKYEAINPATLVRIVRRCVSQMTYTDQLNRCPFFRTARKDRKGLYQYSCLSMVNQANEWAEPVHLHVDQMWMGKFLSLNEKTKLIILCMFAEKTDLAKNQVGLILTISGKIFEFHSCGHGSNRCLVELQPSDGDDSMEHLFRDYPAMAIEVINGLSKLAEKTLKSHRSHVEEWEEPNKFMKRVISGIDFNLPRLEECKCWDN